jgi:hypothetical protein
VLVLAWLTSVTWVSLPAADDGWRERLDGTDKSRGFVVSGGPAIEFVFDGATDPG